MRAIECNADAQFDLGIQDDVRIPNSIVPLAAQIEAAGKNSITVTIQPPARGDVRIVLQQKDADGNIRRSWPGAPPVGKSIGTVLVLRAEQNGKSVPIEVDYDRVVWSGLSWAVGEINHAAYAQNAPLKITCSSMEKEPMTLDANAFVVEYQ
jgi:hypothetical protein